MQATKPILTGMCSCHQYDCGEDVARPFAILRIKDHEHVTTRADYRKDKNVAAQKRPIKAVMVLIHIYFLHYTGLKISLASRSRHVRLKMCPWRRLSCKNCKVLVMNIAWRIKDHRWKDGNVETGGRLEHGRGNYPLKLGEWTGREGHHGKRGETNEATGTRL